MVAIYVIGAMLLSIGFYTMCYFEEQHQEMEWAHREQADYVTQVLDYLQMVALVVFIDFGDDGEGTDSFLKIVMMDMSAMAGSLVDLCPFKVEELLLPAARLVSVALIVVCSVFIHGTVMVVPCLRKWRRPIMLRRLTLLVSFLMTPTIIKVSLEYFRCVQVGDASVMLSVPSAECWTPAHSSVALMMALLAAILGLGIPIAFLIAMRNLKRKYDVFMASRDANNDTICAFDDPADRRNNDTVRSFEDALQGLETLRGPEFHHALVENKRLKREVQALLPSPSFPTHARDTPSFRQIHALT
jgi:hypothetical protein